MIAWLVKEAKAHVERGSLLEFKGKETLEASTKGGPCVYAMDGNRGDKAGPVRTAYYGG